MRYVKPLLIAAALFLPSLLLPPLLVPIALLFAKWREDGRGNLPEWAWMLSTPDQRLPGDTSIPAVADVLAKRGRFVCSWYWLGFRNPAQGLAASFGVPVTQPWSPEPGYYENGSLWWLRKPFAGNRLQLKAGWRTYPSTSGWLAVPCMTVTKP